MNRKDWRKAVRSGALKTTLAPQNPKDGNTVAKDEPSKVLEDEDHDSK